MHVDEIIRHAQRTIDRGRRQLQEQYDGLIASAANLSPDEAERLGELAEKLGRTEAELRSDLTRDRRKASYLFLSPKADYRSDGKNVVYISSIISGVSCGPDFDRNAYRFQRQIEQTEVEFDALVALVANIGPRGALGQPATRDAIALVITRGISQFDAVHLSGRTTTHVKAAALEAELLAARGDGDATDNFIRLLELPRGKRPDQVPEKWRKAVQTPGYWSA